MSDPAVTDWRSGVAARLAGAAVVGGLTGAAALLAGHLMPLIPVPVACRPAGGVGCALFQPLVGLLLGVLLWLLVVVAVALLAGGLLGWLAGRLVGVRLGVAVPLLWPVFLWAIAILLRPVGVTLYLKSFGVIWYIALAYVCAAALTAPQVRRTTRLVAAGLVVLAVVVSLLVHGRS